MALSYVNPALAAITSIQVRNIRVGDELLNLSPSEIKSVTVQSGGGTHDQVWVTTQISKSRADAMAGKTITFDFGPTFRSNTFYGYVLTVSPSQQYQSDTVMDIACFGTTWPMQSGQPRFLTNTTITDAVVALLDEYKIGAYVDAHPFVWPSLAQTGESDWEFLNGLAARAGFTVFPYQGVVRVIDPMRVLQENNVYAYYIKGDDVLDPSRQLMEFNPTTQSLNIRDNVKPSYGFFENGRGVLSNPLVPPYRLDTSYPMQSREMVETFSTAWTRIMGAWNHQATARVQGDAQLIPGVMVGVKTSAASSVNEYDGPWFVHTVKHSLTNSSFQTQMAMARDTNTTAFNTDYRLFWTTAGAGAPRMLRSTTTGKWQTSWRQPVIVSNKLKGVAS